MLALADNANHTDAKADTNTNNDIHIDVSDDPDNDTDTDVTDADWLSGQGGLSPSLISRKDAKLGSMGTMVDSGYGGAGDWGQ